MYQLSEKVLNKLFGKMFQMKLPPTDLFNWRRFRDLEATFVFYFFFFLWSYIYIFYPSFDAIFNTLKEKVFTRENV